eukprot:2474611-Pyramimonas_sp.AAC.1
MGASPRGRRCAGRRGKDAQEALRLAADAAQAAGARTGPASSASAGAPNTAGDAVRAAQAAT